MKLVSVIVFLLFFTDAFSQKTKGLINQSTYGPTGTYTGDLYRVVYTKDILKLALHSSLDSALSLVNRTPIYYLDSLTSKELFFLALNEIPTDRIEYHLVDYSLSICNSEMPELVNDFFEKRINYLTSCKSPTIPIISDESLNAIIKNRNEQTDSILIRYYNTLQKLKKKYRQNYEMHSFHMKCNQILLLLSQTNNAFATHKKIRKHRNHIHQNLVDYLPAPIERFLEYNNEEVDGVINGINDLKSFSDIDITSNSVLLELIEPFVKEYSWVYFMYNDNVAYLDLGYRPTDVEGHGKIYRLELLNDKVIIHLISDWKTYLLE
ncbi:MULTISPECIES: hypothetical protein [unclassified Carboxylicivirga]|uniref:hypothetical protein n=1 Tax=Carboxylicivirga TaxID=1628153 RepID=UPI003D32AA26